MSDNDATQDRRDNDPDLTASIPAGSGEQSILDLGRTVNLHDASNEQTPVHRPLEKDTEIPSIVGRYRIDGEIARGGVGAVFKARDTQLGRDTAIKVILDAHRADGSMLNRFVEEAQITGQLQHPGVVPVHDAGLIASDRPYFAMKLVKGQTLARLLEERASPAADRQRVLGIFEQICQTMAYAHARGVIHRDLKPSNVMVGAFGEVQVMDWGLAKVLARGGAADDRGAGRGEAPKDVSVIETLRSGSSAMDSVAGSVLGTPSYMPPEQARGDVDAMDERSDVFGLGAILCEILTGEPPYNGSDAREVYRAARGGAIEGALARLDACGADETIVELAKRCLSLEPRDRPRDAGVIAASLRAHLESLEERARRHAVEAAEARVRADAERKARGLTLALAGTAVVAVLVSAVAYVWVASEHRAQRDAVVTAFHGALGEARAIRDEAVVSESFVEARWQAALAAVDRALAALEGEDEALAVQATALRAEIESQSRRRRFVARVEELFETSAYQTQEVARLSIERALRDFLGVDLLTLEPKRAAKVVQASGETDAISRAMTMWIALRSRAKEDVRELNDVVLAIDPNPTRRRLIEAQLRSDADAIVALAHEILARDAPREEVVALAIALRAIENVELTERVFRRVIEVDPEAWWPNLAMGEMLFSLGRQEEAIRSLLVAVGRSPRSIFARDALVSRLIAMEEVGEALDFSLPGVVTMAGHFRYHGTVSRIVRSADPATIVPQLERTLETYGRLLGSERIVSSAAFEAEALARAALQRARGELAEALAALETGISHAGPTSSVRNDAAALRALLAPRIPSYASVDARIDAPFEILPAGATWRFFRGRVAPGDGIGWTELDFDDAAWESGPSGFGYGDGDDRTELTDMQGNYTSVYLRARVTLESEIASATLEVLVDDGFIAYVNGERIASWGWPRAVESLPHDATAARSVDNPARRRVSVPAGLLRAGENLIAIHGFNSSATSSDLTLVPVLTIDAPTAEIVAREKAVIKALGADDSPAAPRLVEYVRARSFQRQGHVAEAEARLRAIVEKDQDAFEPAYRLAECVAAAPPSQATRDRLRGALPRDDRRFLPLWTTWAGMELTSPGRAPEAILAALDSDPRRSRASRVANEFRWVLERLAKREPVRINCGGPDITTDDGKAWGRDRFFAGGSITEAGATGWLPTSIDGTDDDPIFAEGRFFWRPDPRRSAYRVPLSPGRYRVALRFAEPYFRAAARRVFDVVLEGEERLSRYDGFARAGFGVADEHAFELDVTDGVLDIEFRSRREHPRIAGIEIVAVE